MNMNDVELCALLSWRIHGTIEAVRCTLYRLKGMVKRQIRPLVAGLARHPKLGRWVSLISGNAVHEGA